MSLDISYEQNVAAKQLTILLNIREVQGLNLSSKAAVLKFFVVCAVTLGKCRNSALSYVPLPPKYFPVHYIACCRHFIYTEANKNILR